MKLSRSHTSEQIGTARYTSDVVSGGKPGEIGRSLFKVWANSGFLQLQLDDSRMLVTSVITAPVLLFQPTIISQSTQLYK